MAVFDSVPSRCRHGERKGYGRGRPPGLPTQKTLEAILSRVALPQVPTNASTLSEARFHKNVKSVRGAPRVFDRAV